MKKSESETAEYIDDIPGVEPLELINGDILRRGKHKVAEIFLKNTPKTEHESAKGIMWKALREAGYSKFQTTIILAKFWKLSHSTIPHDREFFRERNNGTRDLMEDILDKLLTPESTIHGHRNILQIAQLPNEEHETHETKPLAICSNHPSQIDPLILSTLLHRESLAWDNTPIGISSDKIREGLVAVPGHKVMLDGFQRGVSRALHCLFTLQGKYRPLEGSNKELVKAYMDNVGVRLKILLSHPEYFPLIFPEGGLTRDEKIEFEGATLLNLRKSTIAPMYIDDPEGAFRLVDGHIESIKSTTTNLFVGEPFKMKEGKIRESADDFVEQYKKRLLDVGAPIEDVPISWKMRK